MSAGELNGLLERCTIARNVGSRSMSGLAIDSGQASCRRMDRLQKRMDEVGDVEQGDPEAAEPLAARS